jgi:hypothetical protein
MRERKRRERRAHGGGAGEPGRMGQSEPGWVGLGGVAGQKPTTRTTSDRNPIAKRNLKRD